MNTVSHNLLRVQRCIISADGGSEWTSTQEDANKLPKSFASSDHIPIAVPGLRRTWKQQKRPVCWIGTTLAGSVDQTVVKSHGRFSVILRPVSWRSWLASGIGDKESLEGNLGLPKCKSILRYLVPRKLNERGKASERLGEMVSTGNPEAPGIGVI